MNHKITGTLFCAFMAGQAKERRRKWIEQARRESEPGTKSLYVRFARDCHRDLMGWLKGMDHGDPFPKLRLLVEREIQEVRHTNIRRIDVGAKLV